MQAKQFRPYQSEAIDAILDTWQKHRSCIAVMATGGGKTLVAAGVAERLRGKGRILFLANRNELCRQPLEVFHHQLGQIPALEKAEHKASLTADIVIGSVQTLSRTQRLERFPKDHFTHVFADECHLSCAPSWQRIFDHFDGAKLCGITATPFRADARLLRDIFQAEAFRKGLFDLVDEGFLVNPDNVEKLTAAINIANLKVKKGADGVDYDLAGAHDAIAPYFEVIANELKAKYSHRHILAFLPLVASSQKFVAACRAAGLNAVHIDGEDPERDAKLQAFKAGQITLLANSNLLHTGVDMPKCDATLCLRPTKSKVLYQQIVGRSTRTLEGTIDGLDSVSARLNAIRVSAKPDALIIDPLWLSHDHDLITPSFLIAENQEQAVEMNKRAGKSYSLRSLRSEIQREREEAIRRRLENVARFREGRLSALYFGACIHASPIVNYEPVYRWESAPVKNMDRAILSQAGIDPDSVQDQGHARAVIREIYKRRAKGLAEIRSLAPAVESGGITPELWKVKR
jgi:superfamily II DNA or RNA helicase